MKSLLIFLFLVPTVVLSQEFTPAEPRGGERLVRDFIDEEMVYPAKALQASVEGTVTFDFVVQEQGQIRDLEVREPVDPLLKTEASRIFALILWQPAQYRGKSIESKVEFEIPFSVKHYRKACRNRGYEMTELPSVPIDSSGTIYLYRYTDTPPAPLFNKNEMNLAKFMAENFTYPEEALRRNITGEVKVNFIVEPHGRISNIRIVNFLGAGCTEEAIRLVKLLRWKPGMKNGKAVRVSVTIPITFGLSSDGGYNVSPAAGQTTFQ